MIEIGSTAWVIIGLIGGIGLMLIAVKDKNMATGLFGLFLTCYVIGKYLV